MKAKMIESLAVQKITTECLTANSCPQFLYHHSCCKCVLLQGIGFEGGYHAALSFLHTS